MKSVNPLFFILTITALLGIEIMTAPRARGDEIFNPVSRQSYIKKAIDALKVTPKHSVEALSLFVDETERRQCRSFFDSLTLNCLQAEARRYCTSGPGRTQPHCAPLVDVMVVNKVNERQLVSKQERFRISQKTENYAAAYNRLLNSKYALLATDLLFKGGHTCLNSDMGCMAVQIDEYCTKNADSKNIPWQACASALIWFIGS